MSVFTPTTLNCPACGNPVEFQEVRSVNADRKPVLRTAILDRSFQSQECPKCEKVFRLDPEFTYLDVGRGQWLAVFPFDQLPQWSAVETRAADLLESAYGSQASAPARAIGAKLTARVTFGWAGLREKILLRGHQLDDLGVELLKINLVHSLGDSPLDSQTEPRCVDVVGDKLLFAWLRGPTEKIVEALEIPRKLYDDITANQADWKELRTELSAGLFVDMQRLFVEAPAELS